MEDYPLLNLFLTMLWLFLFIIWIWLLISIFGDIFRSDKSGMAKAGWTIFVIILPFLGVLIYLITNGGKMQERAMEAAANMEQAQREYIQSVATSSPADEITKLAGLRDAGTISNEEFEAAKAKLLA